MTRYLLRLCVFLGCTAAAAPLAAQEAGAPAQFLAAWTATTQNPAQAAAAWDSLASSHKEHELGMLARVMLGITRLRDGAEPDSVRELFEVPEPREGAKASELRRRVGEAGKAMLARLAMAKLADRLKSYYAQHVEYPATLDDLVAAKLAKAADIIDPFGKPYGYETRARRKMPGVARQAYTLRCVTTETEHAPLGQVLDAVSQRVTTHSITSLTPADNQAFIRRNRKDGLPSPAQRWTLGLTVDEMTLWAVYDKYLIAGWHGLPRVMTKE
ncbi:MAG: hypothetical protein K8S99_04235 [Planctomycetes bacterium]|nr:hypothetical protein [Planctomycetota bacterium]